MAALKKDRIKDQMIKTAARLWEIPEHELDANFDPLVLLMIEACAAELEKIGFRISDSHSRLVDRLAELLVPDAATGNYPASCILQAHPSESRTQLQFDSSFVTSAPLQVGTGLKAQSLHFDFLPIGQFDLLDAHLKFFVAGGKLYRFNSKGGRELVFAQENEQDSASMWLLIAPGKELTSLQNLQVFFNLRSHSEASQFYYSLANSKAMANGQPASVKSGYAFGEQFILDPLSMLERGHDYVGKISRQVADIYQNRFLHIASHVDATPGSMPAELQQLLPTAIQKEIANEKLVYLQLKLNRPFGQDVFDSIGCNINAFPAVNLRENQVQYKTQDWVNIIPLPTSGYFVGLSRVESSAGHPYHFKYTAGKRSLQEGEALVRSQGVGKTSSREVKEMTENLTEIIRDQCAYFSEMSNDFIVGRLREISTILARLEDRMQQSEELVEDKTYLLLRPLQAGELISATYYSTLGTLAHGLRINTPLQSQKHTLTLAGTVTTLTTPAGGRDAVGANEKQLLLKQQLLSRGRIVTADDVKIASQVVFGDRLEGVAVTKKTAISHQPGQGFQRVIGVDLQIKNTYAQKEEEITYLSRTLENHLAEQSIIGMPFEVKVIVGA